MLIQYAASTDLDMAPAANGVGVDGTATRSYASSQRSGRSCSLKAHVWTIVEHRDSDSSTKSPARQGLASAIYGHRGSRLPGQSCRALCIHFC